jgi:uncharacterized membrane protein YcgQ (UPF0703/DUF1980 family)
MLVRLIGAPDVAPGGWLRVRARLLPGSATAIDGFTPVVQVLDAAPVPEPTDTYEY